MIYTHEEATGATVHDVEGRTKFARVLRVDTDRGEVITQLKRSDGRYVLGEEVHRFETIHPIFGASYTPVLFHCYGRRA